MSDKNFGRKMRGEAVNLIYRKYKLNYFPKLLEDPTISPEDKIKIKDLLKKPWNPYIQSALNIWNTIRHLIPQVKLPRPASHTLHLVPYLSQELFSFFHILFGLYAF
jgi:hypothetical protein